MALVRVEYDGKQYAFDMEDMTTNDAEVMEQAGIPTLKALAERLSEGERVALTFVYWLMKRQDGSKARLDQVAGEFKPMRFLRALDEAQADTEEPEGPKDRNH